MTTKQKTIIVTGASQAIGAMAPSLFLDQGTFDRLAQDAEQNCPISRVLEAEITLNARLV